MCCNCHYIINQMAFNVVCRWRNCKIQTQFSKPSLVLLFGWQSMASFTVTSMNSTLWYAMSFHFNTSDVAIWSNIFVILIIHLFLMNFVFYTAFFCAHSNCWTLTEYFTIFSKNSLSFIFYLHFVDRLMRMRMSLWLISRKWYQYLIVTHRCMKYFWLMLR